MGSLQDRYVQDYLNAFYQQAHPECDHADELLDVVSYATFDSGSCRFQPASKADLFETYMAPVDMPDGSRIVRTLEDAEIALCYLVKTAMVIVDGDVVSVHPRFGYLAAASTSTQGEIP